jgi:hypothetical protein
MAVRVNYDDPPNRPLPGTKWKRLGELKLQADSNPNGTIKAWLVNLLDDLSLPAGFVSRLLVSIEEAILRVLSQDGKEGQFDHLEIVVLAPAGQASKGYTWGFFRVERMSTNSEIEGTKGHCVEYYLYLDRTIGK